MHKDRPRIVIMGVPEVAPSFAKMVEVLAFAHVGLQLKNLPMRVLDPALDLARVWHAPSWTVNPTNDQFSSNLLIQKIALAAMNSGVFPELKEFPEWNGFPECNESPELNEFPEFNGFPGLAHVTMVVLAVVQSFVKMVQV
jgi:hypothetical protein